jgi:hypothetical protein
VEIVHIQGVGVARGVGLGVGLGVTEFVPLPPDTSTKPDPSTEILLAKALPIKVPLIVEPPPLPTLISLSRASN